MTLERMVVGVDGSEGAQRAVRFAADLAASSGAHVHAVHVVSNTWLIELAALQVHTDSLIAEARTQLVGEWTAAFRDSGVDYSIDLLRGDPGRMLVEYTVSHHGHLIVVGASRHSGLHDELLGGTAHHVVNRSSIPVLVVPREATPRPDRPVPIPG
jgi:nucleotide-binding universal stress UspA family protein